MFLFFPVSPVLAAWLSSHIQGWHCIVKEVVQYGGAATFVFFKREPLLKQFIIANWAQYVSCLYHTVFQKKFTIRERLPLFGKLVWRRVANLGWEFLDGQNMPGSFTAFSLREYAMTSLWHKLGQNFWLYILSELYFAHTHGAQSFNVFFFYVNMLKKSINEINWNDIMKDFNDQLYWIYHQTN